MSILRKVAIVFWIPFLMEASAIPFFLIPIPGLPLSLGRTCLVVLGVIGVFYSGKHFISPYAKVVLMFVVACFVGTFFSDNFLEDLLSFVGVALLWLASYSAASLLRLPETNILLKYFFYLVYSYWLIYIYNSSFSGGEVVSYGEVYREGREDDNSLLNFHSFGLVFSAALVFLAQLNGWLRSLKLVGVAFVLVGVTALFLTESRANFLITLFVLICFYALNNKIKFKNLLKVGVVLFLIGYSASYFMSRNERLNRRFDVKNTSYIEQSTTSRFEFIALTFEEILELPLGGGVRNTRVNYYGVEYQPHNQFLTIILFGGVGGIVANILWIKIFARTAFRIIKKRYKNFMPYLIASTLTMLVLLTNDISGAFFFLMLMFQIWLSKEVHA